MSQCKNRIGERCKLNGELCNHLVYDGKCNFADVDTIGKISFKQALDLLLEHHKCTDTRKFIYKRAFNVVISYCGFTWDDPIEDFTYDVAEKFVKTLEDKYEKSTIATWLHSIYLSGNIEFRTYYKENGLKRPFFERIPYKVDKKDKPKLEWEQKTAIWFEMERLRRMALDETVCDRKRLQARNYFIALWFGWWFGARPGDINNMKWKNFTYINGIPHIQWKPSKTLDSTGIEICWPINGDGFNQIRRFIQNPDENCIISEDKFIPNNENIDSQKRYNIHHYMWKSINKFFRSIGVEGWAGFYTLRYMNSQETYKTFGENAERMKLGHSVLVAQRSYYNKNDHSVV